MKLFFILTLFLLPSFLKAQDFTEHFKNLPEHWFDMVFPSPSGLSDYEMRAHFLKEGDKHEVILDEKRKWLTIRDLSNELLFSCSMKQMDEETILLAEFYEGGDCDSYHMSVYKIIEGSYVKTWNEEDGTIQLEQFFESGVPMGDIDAANNVNWQYIIDAEGTIMVEPVSLADFICLEPKYQKYGAFASPEIANQAFLDYVTTINSRTIKQLKLTIDKEGKLVE